MSPEDAGIDPKALATLVEAAERSKSDSLVVLKNGKLVGAWTFGKPDEPIELMSVTKSVVGSGSVYVGR